MTMSIPLVDTLLGHSVSYEEYKGNFAGARQVAEQWLEHAQLEENPVENADALLALGIVHLLQGEPPAAQACFKHIERLVPTDPERQFRAAIYSSLATNLYLNTLPNGKSAIITITECLDRINDFTAQTKEISRRRVEFGNRITNPAIQLEDQFVHALLAEIPTSRSFLNNLGTVPKAMAVQALGMALQIPLDFRQQAPMLGAEPGMLAYADLVAADLYWRVGQYNMAVQFLNEASTLYQQAGDLAGAALCQVIQGDWLSAPFSTPLVWNFAIQDSGQQSSELAWALEAEEDRRVGLNVEAARAAYRSAENLFTQANAPRGLAAIQLRYGYLAHLEADYTTAANCARQAQEGFGASGDRLGYWLARAHYALSRIAAGQHPEERDTAQAIGTWGATEGSFSYALGLGLLFARAGRHRLMRVGDYEGALACYRLAQALYEKLGTTTNVSQALVDQGAIYRLVGDYNTALTFYEPALTGYEQDASTRPLIAEGVRTRVILLAVNIYQLSQGKRDANGVERTARRIQQQLDRLPPEDTASGGTTEAVNMLRIRFGRSVIQTATVEVPLYRALQAREDGREAIAEQWFAAAIAAAQTVSDDQRNFLVASVLGAQHKYGEAAKAFQQYLQRGGANAGWSGQLMALLTKYAGAARQAEERMQERRTHEQAALFFRQVEAYDEAMSHLKRLEHLAGPEWWTQDEHPWEVLSLYGDVYGGLGKLEQALASYERAVTELEQRRTLLTRDELKTALAGGRSPQQLYFRAARTAVDLQLEAQRVGDLAQAQHYAVQAFGYAERGKARGLLDLMFSNVALARSPDTESKPLHIWQQANARLVAWRSLLASQFAQPSPDPNAIAYLKQQIAAIEADVRRAETDLATSNPRFYQMVSFQGQVLSLDQVSAALPPGTALLHYYFMGEDLLALAITRQGIIQTYQVHIDTKALDRHIRDFHQACKQRGQLDELGVHLAETLLIPLGQAIRNNPDLIVVPHGTAHLLPFHVLPWEGQPLIATHTLSYLPSASALQFLHQSPAHSSTERLLAVGNPAHMAFQPPLGGEPIPQDDLPWSGIEAAYVTSLFSQSSLLNGGAATESALLAGIPIYPLLHIASHGYLSEDAPLLSSILLAEGEELSLYELLGLQLNARLVVLSACDTGRGEATGGDDVLGLTHGLLGAGAHAAVVSLWSVNDVATSLLMGHFYESLRAGNPPRVALQAAQNHLRSLHRDAIKEELGKLKAGLEKIEPNSTEARLLKPHPQERAVSPTPTSRNDYSHPFYWAPFILVG